MKRRIAIYLLVAAALIGAGLLVSILFADDEEARGAAAATGEPAEGPAVTPDPASAADAGRVEPDAGTASGAVRVLGIRGRAERQAVGGEDWAEIATGDLLAADDSVRTGDDAGLTLGLGTASTVDLGGGAQVRVREVSDSVQRLGLVRGRVSVRYKEDGARVLRIENEDGSAVAEAREGTFTVLGSGRTLSVATETGEVDLSAEGQKVAVVAGQQSAAVDGERPTRPAAIPVDLLLKVTDPGCRVQREPFIVIRGRTAAGALVRVNDTPGVAGVDGRFSVRVPLQPGRNTIVLAVEDVSGRIQRRTFPCVTVDPRAPIEKIDIQWGAPSGGGA